MSSSWIMFFLRFSHFFPMCVKYSGYCDLEFIPLSPEKNPIADSLCHYFYAHIKYSICPKIIPGLWTIQTVWLVRVAHWWIWFLFSYSDYFYEPDTQHMRCSTKVKTHYYNCGLRGSRQQNIQMRINAKLLNVTYHKKEPISIELDFGLLCQMHFQPVIDIRHSATDMTIE